jgi:hypothetical protein
MMMIFVINRYGHFQFVGVLVFLSLGHFRHDALDLFCVVNLVFTILLRKDYTNVSCFLTVRGSYEMKDG